MWRAQVDVSKATNVLDRWIVASTRLLVHSVRWAWAHVSMGSFPFRISLTFVWIDLTWRLGS
jgi:hypothetical protein